jgi:hypothetical protein
MMADVFEKDACSICTLHILGSFCPNNDIAMSTLVLPFSRSRAHARGNVDK